jgi:hypothetical protein
MARFSSLKRLAFGSLLAGSLVAGGVGVVAQDEAATGPSHPAHIHAGTCDDLEPNPVAPLNNLELRQNEDADDNTVQGTLTASQMFWSGSDELDLNWDDMLATSHSVNVHESDENIQTYIACGEIGGIVVDDSLVIGLHQLNDSGYSGIAILRKDGDDNVDVEVYLAGPPASEMDPAATPPS